MTGTPTPPPRPDQGAPPTDKRRIVAAGVLLLIPIAVLMWVPHYSREDPELFGFPFFFWYQFLWVFLCAGMTWGAYRLVLGARPTRDRRDEGGGR